jgi:hypothetical protein
VHHKVATVGAVASCVTPEATLETVAKLYVVKQPFDSMENKSFHRSGEVESLASCPVKKVIHERLPESYPAAASAS